VWEELKTEINLVNTNKILFSEEAISTMYIDKWIAENWKNFILSYLPDYIIKVILYIRRIDDRFKSHYCQDIKGPSTLYEYYYENNNIEGLNYPWIVCSETYIDFFNRVKCENPARIYPSIIIDALVNDLGNENLILRIYDRDSLKNNNVIDDLFCTLGLEPPDLPRVIDSNPSQPSISLVLKTSAFIPREADHDSRYALYKKIDAAYRGPRNDSVGSECEGKFQAEIERIDSLLPGYKNLFDKRKCSFGYSELDMDPKDRLIFDLLFSLFRQNMDLLKIIRSDANLDQLSIDDVKAAMFPNLCQRIIIEFYHLYFKYILDRQIYQHFRRELSDFIRRPDLYPSKKMRRILAFFGPVPSVERPATK
jgi:hypothetical protein